MTDIPEFRGALADFRSFLQKEGHPSEITWAFREDLWPRRSCLNVRRPIPDASEALAHKVYEEGRARGLVQLMALGQTADGVVATVWFPKYPSEEVQGWSVGLKLSVRIPLPSAIFVPGWIWPMVRLLPSYRGYQAHDVFVGTKRWAAA